MKKHQPPKGHWLDNLLVWLGQQLKSEPDFSLSPPLSPREFWSSLTRINQEINLTWQQEKQLSNHRKLIFTYSSRIIRKETVLNTVKGVFYESLTSPEKPVILLIHGNGMPNHLWEEKYASYLLDLGYQVAYLDLPYHMSRRPPKGKRKSLSANLQMTCLNLGQGIIDSMDLLNWLREERKIKKVGVLGTSLGGLLSLLLTAKLPLDLAIVLTPLVDLSYLLWEGIPLGGIREKIKKGGISSSEELASHLLPFSPSVYRPLIPPEKIFLVKGELDEIVGSQNIERLIQDWRLSNVLRLPQGHLSTSLNFFFLGFPRELRKFLRENI